MQDQLREQATTITLILVKLLVQSDLSLEVDTDGNMTYIKRGTNQGAVITAKEINRLYEMQREIIKE